MNFLQYVSAFFATSTLRASRTKMFGVFVLFAACVLIPGFLIVTNHPPADTKNHAASRYTFRVLSDVSSDWTIGDAPVDDDRQNTPFFCPGDDYKVAYKKSVRLKTGDLLWIHGLAETTNDLRDSAGNWKTALIEMRISVRQSGHPLTILANSRNGVNPRGLHHLPLNAAALYAATHSGEVDVLIEIRVSQASQVYCRPSAKQFVFLNNTYGGIFIAHFRPTQELAGSSADRSFALKEVVRSTAVAATQEEYGRCSLSRSPAMPYSVTPLLGIGDIALIVAQTSVRLYDMPPTSLACDGRPNSFTLTEPVSSDGCSSTSRSSRFDGVQIPDDLHGLTLGKNLPSLRSFMASENVSTCLPISTLSVHGVLRAKQGGYARISTLVSGLTGYGGIVIPNGGHILALTFSPLEQLTSPALLLADAGQVSFPPTQLAKTVPSNGAPAPPPVASFQIDLPAGAQLWVAGSSIIAPTSGDNVCSSLLTLEDENGATVQHSPTTARSSNVDTLALPLENEEVFSIPRQGTYKTTMRISCADDSNISSETRLSYLMFSRETVSP